MQVNSAKLLEPGRHTSTLSCAYETFVERAPHREQRELIWQAFEMWCSAIERIVKVHQYWLDGGFVTHKPEAPQDLDVVFLCSREDLNAIPTEDQPRLKQLLTDASPESRIQPMGGLIDAFLLIRGNVEKTAYWNTHWQRVKGAADPNVRKGFLVVKTNE